MLNSIQLEKQAQDYILENIRNAVNNKKNLIGLMDLLEYQYVAIDFVDKPLDEFGNESPLDLYCSYTLDQILVTVGKHTESKKSSFREGVLYLAEKNLDVFL